MITRKSVSSLKAACLFFGAFALLVCSGALPGEGASAQPPAPAAPAEKAAPPHNPPGGPGGPMGPMSGPPLDPEKMHKAWDATATAVAQDLGLNPELTAKLVDAYKAARMSQMAAMREKMKPGERPDFNAMAEVNKAEKAKLDTALKGFLTPEQAAKALPVLGTLGRRLDPMVAALDTLGLDDKTKAAAMKLVLASAVESDAAMQAAGADRGGMREKAMEIRQKLNAEMAKVLSPEQMTKWKEATEMRGPRGMGRGPGGPAPKAPAPPAPPAAK